MSAVDLVILGYLKRQPAGAYDLAREIENSRTKKIVKIGSPTIYQNTKKLAQKGYLAGTRVKQGEMPEKVIYGLTEKGEGYFLDLMRQYSADPGRMFFNFNSFVKNLSLVHKKHGMEMLNNLRRYFYHTRDDLHGDRESIPSPPLEVEAIMNQYDILLNGMIQWVEDLMVKYQKEKGE